MSDYSDNQILNQSYESDAFQQRCRLRFLSAAISVVNESSSTTSHTQRVAFAGALFNGTVNTQMLAMVVLASSTNRANCLATGNTQVGGNILDADIDTQVSSVFTGIATSRSW